MTATASLIPIGRQRGFTYVSVVILVAIIGLVGAMSLRLGTTMQRAAAEQALQQTRPGLFPTLAQG